MGSCLHCFLLSPLFKLCWLFVWYFSPLCCLVVYILHASRLLLLTFYLICLKSLFNLFWPGWVTFTMLLSIFTVHSNFYCVFTVNNSYFVFKLLHRLFVYKPGTSIFPCKIQKSLRKNMVTKEVFNGSAELEMLSEESGAYRG